MSPFDRLLGALRSQSLDPDTAVSERIAPLLHFAAPNGSAPALRREYYGNAGRNLLLLESLDGLMAAFAARGVFPVVIKGADFARRLYPDAALRPMSDLDLWVSPADVARAEAVLDSLGFRAAIPDMTPGLSHAIRHARLYAGGARGDVGVDLHWSLVGHASDRRVPDLDWFRERAKNSRLDATSGLLYLAAHMKVQHYDERAPLIWLSDFYLLSWEEGIDWAELFDAARAFGWEAALAATAAETQARLGVELPPPLAAFARTASVYVPEHKGGPEHAWNELLTLTMRGRVSLLKAILVPSPAYVRFRYRPRPSWTWPLFYPVRWARVLSGGVALAVKRRRARPLLGDTA